MGFARIRYCRYGCNDNSGLANTRCQQWHAASEMAVAKQPGWPTCSELDFAEQFGYGTLKLPQQIGRAMLDRVNVFKICLIRVAKIAEESTT